MNGGFLGRDQSMIDTQAAANGTVQANVLGGPWGCSAKRYGFEVNNWLTSNWLALSGNMAYLQSSSPQVWWLIFFDTYHSKPA